MPKCRGRVFYIGKGKCPPSAAALWLGQSACIIEGLDFTSETYGPGFLSSCTQSTTTYPCCRGSRASVTFPPKIDRVSWGGAGDKISEGTDGLHRSLSRTFPWPGVESGTITSPAYGAGPRLFEIGGSPIVLSLPDSRCRVGPGTNPPAVFPWPSLSLSARSASQSRCCSLPGSLLLLRE